MSVTDVFVVYNDENIIKELGDTVKVSPIFHFIDYRSKNGKKEAWKLMNHWAAKEVPFALVMNGPDVIKAFYSEDTDVIKSLINYLNGN